MTNASKEETHVTAPQTASAALKDAHAMPEKDTSWVEQFPADWHDILLNWEPKNWEPDDTATQTASAALEDAHGTPEENTSWVEKYPAEWRDLLLNCGYDDTDNDRYRDFNESIISLSIISSESSDSRSHFKDGLERMYMHESEREEDYAMSGMTDRMTIDEFYDFAYDVLEIAVYRGWELPDDEAVRKRRWKSEEIGFTLS